MNKCIKNKWINENESPKWVQNESKKIDIEIIWDNKSDIDMIKYHNAIMASHDELKEEPCISENT